MEELWKKYIKMGHVSTPTTDESQLAHISTICLNQLVHLRGFTHTHSCKHTHALEHMCTHTHIDTHTHTHTHHTHIHMDRLTFFSFMLLNGGETAHGLLGTGDRLTQTPLVNATICSYDLELRDVIVFTFSEVVTIAVVPLGPFIHLSHCCGLVIKSFFF